MEALRTLHLEAGALSTTRWLGTALPLDGEMGSPMPRDAPPELVDEAVVDETTEDGTRGDALSAAGTSSDAQYGAARTLHQLFVTANPILRTAVARSISHRIAIGLPSECHRIAIGVPSDCHMIAI
jgi:hypothetical protein